MADLGAVGYLLSIEAATMTAGGLPSAYSLFVETAYELGGSDEQSGEQIQFSGWGGRM